MKTGVIGLGAMGAPMARNLQGDGLLAGVWNRTASVAQALGDELGLSAAESIEQLVAASDAVIVCVSADNDVLEVVRAIAAATCPGMVVIDTSTVSAATSREAAALLAARQVDYLDCPVSGGVEGARKGTLAVMAGGDADVLKKVAPVLESIAANVVHMGPVGSGQATKAVNQIMAAGINQAVTEALAFAQAQGLPLNKVIDVVGSGAAGNWFLTHRGPSMTRDCFDPGFRLALHHKDLKICVDMAEACDLPLPVTDMTLAHYEGLMAEGYGDEDISALYRHKKPDQT